MGIGAFVLVTLTATAMAADAGVITSSRDVVWLGVDYSRAAFVGESEFADYRSILPVYPEKWNRRVRVDLEKDLRKALRRDVVWATEGVAARHRELGPERILKEAGAVEHKAITVVPEFPIVLPAYTVPVDQGVALVIVVDSLISELDTACLSPVFFDVATRQVLWTERWCTGIEGFGTYNRWFSAIEQSVDRVGDYVKIWEKG